VYEVSDWKNDLTPMTLAAVEWLEAHHPEKHDGYFCEPGWVLASMIEAEYPGGYDRFSEDFLQGQAVS
jgi:hypothetical protein